MLLGGDEIGRTQDGNNNAYCQDNEISWFDWDLDERRASELLEFTRRLIALRREHPVFRRSTLPRRRARAHRRCPTSWWFRPDGRKMTRRDWERAAARRLGVFLNGDELRDASTRRASRSSTTRSCPLQRRTTSRVEFTLPPRRFGRRWAVELSTADPDAAADEPARRARRSSRSRSRSLVAAPARR